MPHGEHSTPFARSATPAPTRTPTRTPATTGALSPTTPTPADLYRHGLRLLLDKDMDAWVALCDEQVIFEFPFAPDGCPKRLEEPWPLAAYLKDYPDHIDLQAFPALKIHHTDAPDTVVVEMRATGRIVATGAPYEMPYIAVVTVLDGRITHYRDYWNPLALPASMGTAKSAPLHAS